MKPKTPSNITIAKIVKAIQFIEDNLNQKLILEEIAKYANFSNFHFHRLFSIVTKETVNGFITRKRLERAAGFLIRNNDISITEIAEMVGYSNLSSFSRGFKKFYGMSPLQFRELSPQKFSKICKTESKNGQIKVNFEEYICNLQESINWIQMNALNITVKKLPEFSLAYVHHKGKIDDIGIAYHQLIKWATPLGLLNTPNLQMMTIYHDSPKISDPNNIGMSACIVLKELIKSNGIVNSKTFTPSKCIVSRFEIKPSEFQQAWESNFVWMSENGYQKSEIDPFEIFHNNAESHSEGKFIVDLCIPVA